MGTFTRKLREQGQGSRVEKGTKTLRPELEGAKDDKKRATVLLAIANSGSPELNEPVLPYQKSADRGVQDAAIQAVRLMARPEVETTRTWLVLGAASLLAIWGCSDDGGSDSPDATDRASGAGAGSETGGTSSDTGGSTGTGGGAATGGSELPGAHCQGLADANPYGWVMSICDGHTRDIDLVGLAEYVDIRAGIAFSVELQTSDGADMELWGTNEECGEPLELLDTQPMGDAIRCMEGAPQEGTYTHLLWYWEGGGFHADVTWCDSGMCS